jgi:hypothetical protein
LETIASLEIHQYAKQNHFSYHVNYLIRNHLNLQLANVPKILLKIHAVLVCGVIKMGVMLFVIVIPKQCYALKVIPYQPRWIVPVLELQDSQIAQRVNTAGTIIRVK